MKITRQKDERERQKRKRNKSRKAIISRIYQCMCIGSCVIVFFCHLFYVLFGYIWFSIWMHSWWFFILHLIELFIFSINAMYLLYLSNYLERHGYLLTRVSYVLYNLHSHNVADPSHTIFLLCNIWMCWKSLFKRQYLTLYLYSKGAR